MNPKIRDLITKLDQECAALPPEEVRAVYQLVAEVFNTRLSLNARLALREWKVGDRVAFEGKHGGVLVGTIERLNRKTATVAVPGPAKFTTRWRVSAELLREPTEAVAQ